MSKHRKIIIGIIAFVAIGLSIIYIQTSSRTKETQKAIANILNKGGWVQIVHYDYINALPSSYRQKAASILGYKELHITLIEIDDLTDLSLLKPLPAITHLTLGLCEISSLQSIYGLDQPFRLSRSS